MKTTLDIPDSLIRQIKAHAAIKGQTMKLFFIDAVKEKLTSEAAFDEKQSGWRTVFGTASNESVSEVQAIIDEEFSNVDPDAWK